MWHVGLIFLTFSDSQENSEFKAILTFNLGEKFAIVMLQRKR